MREAAAGQRWRAGALACALLGCNTVQYRTDRPPTGESQEFREDYFLCGLVGEHTVDLDAVCPGGVAHWENQETFSDGLLTCLTFGIYAPITVKVDCASGQAFELVPNPQTGRLCVRSRSPRKEAAP